MEDETLTIEPDPTPAKKKKARRRRPKVTRAWLILMGKKRIQADDAGVSSGLLYYVIDGVHTYMPVTRKVQILPGNVLVNPGPMVGPAPAIYGAPPTPYDPPTSFFTRTQEEDVARAEQFAAERSNELENLMRPAFRLAPIEEEEEG